MGLPSVKMDKELLKWGIQNSDPEKLKEAASNFDPKQVDPELIDYILQQQQKAPCSLKDCVDKIMDVEGRVLENRLEAFEILHEMVENIDHSIAMENLGLWPSIQILLKDKSDQIRTYAMCTFAAAAQNNPKAQEALLRHGIIALAMGALGEADEALSVKEKSVLFISAIVKQNPNAFIEFNRLKGFHVMKALMESHEESLQRRAAFFLGHLFEERTRLKTEHAALFGLVTQFNSEKQ